MKKYDEQEEHKTVCDILLLMNVVIFIVQINCNWLQWSNIKVYKDIF
jgi:DNA-binding transcriptional regulator of glucitol operon